jgi:hypothetical protein
MSKKFIPELNYWFEQFNLSSTLNKDLLFFSSSFSELFLNRKSFIELMFNDNYSQDEYIYKYLENTNKGSWPQTLLNRLMIYPLESKYYECNEEGENLFQLESVDLVLLDTLLEYRLDSDSTSIIILSYSECDTDLSKLIQIYLDFQINGNYSNYDNEDLVSDSNNVLNQMFEQYLLNSYFTTISAREAF